MTKNENIGARNGRLTRAQKRRFFVEGKSCDRKKPWCDRIWCPNFCSLNLVHKNGVTDFFSPEFGTRKEFGHPWWSPLKRLISVTVLEPVDAPHFGPLIGSRSPYWIPLKQRISKIEHKAFANPPKPNSRSPD